MAEDVVVKDKVVEKPVDPKTIPKEPIFVSDGVYRYEQD